MPPRRIVSALVCSTLAAALAGCERARPVFEPAPRTPYVPPTAVDTGPIHVGVFGSLHGRESASARAEWQGIVLAVEERNATTRVQDRPLELVVLDDLGRARGAEIAGERFRGIDRVAMILGGTNAVRAGLAATNAKEIPLLAPCIPHGEAAASWALFGGAPPVDGRARRLHEHLHAIGLAGETHVVRRKDNALDREIARAFARAQGLATLPPERDDVCTTESLPELFDRWIAAPPACVLVPFEGPDAALFVATARKRGVPSTTTFATAFEPDLDTLGAGDRGRLDGTIAASAFAPLPAETSVAENATTTRDDAREADEAWFARRYRARFESEPHERAWLGYAAARGAFDALARATTFSPEDVRAALESSPEPASTIHILRVEAGRLVRALAPKP